MKTIVLMNAAIPGGPQALAGRPWARHARRIVVQVTEAMAGGSPPPAYATVVEIWSDAPLAAEIAADAAFGPPGVADVRTSQEVIGKPAPAIAPAGPVAGLSQISFIAALPGLDRAEVERHWSEHIPLANAIHVGMERYVQDRLSPAAAGHAPWFGMAHLHFPDARALTEGLFRNDEDIATITADVAEFVAEHATMLAREHVVKA